MLAYCKTQRSVRDERWKLICLPALNKTMLFDLKEDPWETKDLNAVPEFAERRGTMMALLAKEQELYGDTLPLKTNNPRPARFSAPSEKQKTPYPAGGLAPGVAPK